MRFGSGHLVKSMSVLAAAAALAGGAAGCGRGKVGAAATVPGGNDTGTPSGSNAGTTPAPGATPTDTAPPPGATATPIPTAPVLAALPASSPGFSPRVSNGDGGAIIPISPVPQPTGGTIKDRSAAVRLGKALFWDAQAGSDGKVACATCHFRAGADARTTATVNPGGDALFQIAADAAATFSPHFFSGDDVVGSAGVYSKAFSGISPDLSNPVDVCADVTPDGGAQQALFNAGQRLVTGRQAPPAVGAVFFLDNFWDGRASHRFNGQNPLGTGAGPFVENASLASQSVGPPLSGVEMSCAGRTFNGPNSLGAKLVPRTPLAQQLVDPGDSVLGPLSNAPNLGLSCGFPDRLCTYADLIAGAFDVPAGQDAVTFFVANFASIWGQAIQAYEATLVPDRTPYDLGTLTANQVKGLQRFRAKCAVCHAEPEFSDATVRLIAERGGPSAAQSAGEALGADQGFHNIGVAPTALDHGRKASPGGTYHDAVGNDGAFKTPALRNVKLTAPYMHNGALATLGNVLDFYDSKIVQVANAEIDTRAVGAGVGGDRAAVLDFLENGLTDCRVEHELAPFDHPALALPNGPALPARGKAGDGTACP